MAAVSLAMYNRIADLPLVITDYELQAASLDTSSDFTRVSTIIALTGGDTTGYGEDVGYEADDQTQFQTTFADNGLALAGEYTFASFSSYLDTIELFPDPPSRPADRKYRRWGFESAALDLALKQADTDLGHVLNRSYDPIEFVVSTRLESVDRLDDIRAINPTASFKLDPTPDWGESLIAAISERGGVRILDLKGHYEGTEVDNEANPDLYHRITTAFPDAVIEDPAFTPETNEIITDIADRVSWDAPISDVASIERLQFEPEWLNIKPSRFGTFESLLTTITYCEEHDISMYGGGQFELGVGRDQIQLLASLFYPDTWNDVAPTGYNAATLDEALPGSPLPPPTDPTGFQWGPAP